MIRIPSNKAVFTMGPGHEPVQTVESGETVVVETMDCFSNTITSDDQLFSSIGWDCVNPATGPIAVAGAEPGDTLRVEILDIKVASTGTMTTHPDFGALPGTVEERTRRIAIEDGQVVFNDRVRFPINIMIGVIGTAPADEEVPTGSPKEHGGNMDTKKIAAGTVLYLPVNVPGANLAIGDVHAAMGDGEVSVSGLEIAAEVTIRVHVVKGRPLPLPFLLTADQAIAIASRETLDEAVAEATRMMRDYLVQVTDLDATDALMLLSLRGDLAVSQIVDPLKTARMEIPRYLLEAYRVELA